MRFTFLITFLIAFKSVSFGQWLNDIDTPNDLCVASDLQYAVNYNSDKEGNLYTIWADYRNGKTEVYVQKSDKFGKPLWNKNGVKVGTIMDFVDYTYTPKNIEFDESGGATIAWHRIINKSDLRQRTIFGNYIDSNGNVSFGEEGLSIDSQITFNEDPNSCIISGFKTSQNEFSFVYDVSNSNYSDVKVYLKKISQGSKLSEKVLFNGNSTGSKILYDVSKNQFVALMADNTLGYQISSFDINGNVLKKGFGISNDFSDSKHRIDYYKLIDSEVFVGRTETSNGTNNVYAHKFDSNLEPKWGLYGKSLGVPTSFDIQVSANSDGGAILTWIEPNNPTARLKSARIDAKGDILWAKGVFNISNTKTHIIPNKMCGDNADGVYCLWFTSKSTGFDISVQHVDKNGDYLFSNTDGIINQFTFYSDYRIVSHPFGGAVVLYGSKKDLNNDVATNVNLYTNYLRPNGAFGLGEIISASFKKPKSLFCPGEEFDINIENSVTDNIEYRLLFSKDKANFNGVFSLKRNNNGSFTIPSDFSEGQYYLKIQNSKNQNLSINSLVLNVEKLKTVSILKSELKLCDIKDQFKIESSSCTNGVLEWTPALSQPLKLGENKYFANCVLSGCQNSENSNIININVANINSKVPGILSVFEGESIQLSANGGVKYFWSGPNSFSSTESSPLISNATIQQSGNYTVKVFDENNCSKEYPVSVTVNKILSSSFEINYENKIYPNPVNSNNITLDLSGFPKEIFSLYVFDNQGRLIKKEQIFNRNEIIEIPLNLVKGSYNLLIKSKSKEISKKILVN